MNASYTADYNKEVNGGIAGSFHIYLGREKAQLSENSIQMIMLPILCYCRLKSSRPNLNQQGCNRTINPLPHLAIETNNPQKIYVI